MARKRIGMKKLREVLRLKSTTGENESPHHARELRTTIARILTVLSERNQGIRGEKPHVSE